MSYKSPRDNARFILPEWDWSHLINDKSRESMTEHKEKKRYSTQDKIVSKKMMNELHRNRSENTKLDYQSEKWCGRKLCIEIQHFILISTKTQGQLYTIQTAVQH